MHCLSLLLLAASLVYGEKDGYREVTRATQFCADDNLTEGAAFIAGLRERPRESLTPVELQAEDMAEFALYRADPAHSNDCIRLLRQIHAAGPTTIWGWAAVGFLEDFHALDTITLPPKDPYLYLGDVAVGVLDFNPRRLACAASPTPGEAARLREAALSQLPPDLDDRDLAPGSPIRRAILRAALIDLCTPAAVDRILSAERGRELFARLWDDDATLDAFMLSGPVFTPPAALETLMTIYLNDADGWAATEEGRKISVAVALNTRSQQPDARWKTGRDDDALFLVRMRCYAAYRRLSQLHRFHESTAKRDTREWRFIVRDPTHPADVLYLNSHEFDYAKPGKNIRFVPYRTRNCFGDIIFQHDSYYRTWRHCDWPYWYMVHRVGGVCNRQSTFATVCANAHGLMSERAGQPGHCAWLLRDEEGNWIIRNNINKYTNGVFLFWGRGYQYIQAGERAFADRAAWQRSELLRFAARLRPEATDLLLDRSLAACPYNLSTWREYTDRLKTRPFAAATWQAFLDRLVRAMPDGRTATWDLAFEALYELRRGHVPADELQSVVSRLITALREPERTIGEEMDYEGVVLRRAARLFCDDPERQLRLLLTALEANWGTREYFSQILAQGLSMYADEPEQCERLLDEFSKLAARHASAGEGLKGKGVDFNSLIGRASATRQRAAFQTLAALRNRLDPPRKGRPQPTHDFDAKLISDRGLLYIGDSARRDSPQDYPRVIDASPVSRKRTHLISISHKAPWAVVELQGLCDLSGIVVTGKNMAGLTVSVSDDGNDWQPLPVPADATATALRLYCTSNRPRAKFVRVSREGGASTDPLCLRKLLVYGDTLY